MSDPWWLLRTRPLRGTVGEQHWIVYIRWQRLKLAILRDVVTVLPARVVRWLAR